MRHYKKSRIKSLERGFEVLKCFSSDKPILRLTDITNKLGISRATVFRYISTLKDLGYLSKDDEFKGYKLTVKVLDFGFSALSSLDFVDISLPFLEDLAHNCQESASMAILDGPDVLYVARTATKRWISTNLQVGSKLPAYCTSLGKALLAYKSFGELKEIIKLTELKPYTPNTITDLDTLKEILVRIRQDGYAISNQELEIGHVSAAAPIYNVKGEVVAAINISMSSVRVSLDELKQKFIPILTQTAKQISNALGYYILLVIIYYKNYLLFERHSKEDRDLLREMRIN